MASFIVAGLIAQRQDITPDIEVGRWLVSGERKGLGESVQGWMDRWGDGMEVSDR